MNFANPEETALEGIERFEAFLTSIGMPVTLRELGGDPADIPALAASTKKDAQGLVGNFTRLNAAAVEAILRLSDK